MLYPLRFKTQFKEKIWGGNKINTILGKDFFPLKNCGETWELSTVPENISIIDNGFLKGKLLSEAIDIHKQDLVGTEVWKNFGNDFPLLIKFIDAKADLSIQVHPNDELALARHGCKGKTEMWYILDAEKGSILNSGFNQPVTKETYIDKLESGKLTDLLNFEQVHSGDVFFLPAGRVHYIGKGILLAEIQQTSDITYRIYDFDRLDDQGNKRDLHTDEALDALDFTVSENYKTPYIPIPDNSVNLVTSPYFTTNILELHVEKSIQYEDTNTFRIYIVTEGQAILSTDNHTETLSFGDVILIPSIVKEIKIQPQQKCKILEVYL